IKKPLLDSGFFSSYDLSQFISFANTHSHFSIIQLIVHVRANCPFPASPVQSQYHAPRQCLWYINAQDDYRHLHSPALPPADNTVRLAQYYSQHLDLAHRLHPEHLAPHHSAERLLFADSSSLRQYPAQSVALQDTSSPILLVPGHDPIAQLDAYSDLPTLNCSQRQDKCLTGLGTGTRLPLSNLWYRPDSGTGQLYHVSAMDIQPDYKTSRRYKSDPPQIELQSANAVVQPSDSFVCLYPYL